MEKNDRKGSRYQGQATEFRFEGVPVSGSILVPREGKESLRRASRVFGGLVTEKNLS